MKGIIIYGDPMWGDNERATYCEFINNASIELNHYAPKTITSCLKGEASESSKAVCSESDTYDFMTGALISLMKMCGLEKSAKAYAEIFDDTAYGDALIERDKLKEKVDGLYAYNKRLIEEIDQKNHNIISLKALRLTNESLKKDDELFRRACEKLKEENSRLINTRDLLTNKNNELMEKNKRLNASICAKEVLNDKLLKGYNAAQSAYEIMVEKSADLMDKVKKLEEENEKLKLDCEKLQHGYIDTDMIFCGGRQNGKQYTLLVELFKKIPKEKVQAAYIVAYKESLIWCTSQPSIRDQLASLLESSKYVIPTEFTFKIDQVKPLTKREKMWGDILGDHKYGGSLGVKVEKAFINDFLSEAEDNGLVWANGGEKPTEWDRWEDWRRHDYVVFRIWYWGKTKELTWGNPPDERTINYLPPMRWDLFKRGRLAVKVNYENYKEFYEACENVLDKKPFRHTVLTTVYTGPFTVSICKKDGNFEVFSIKDQKKTGRKIVDWEDVK